MSEAATPARAPTKRVFFALWPGEALRTTFARAIHKAARACGGRPVPPHNFHVTLVFLGSVAAARIPELEAIGARVAGLFRPPGAGSLHAGADAAGSTTAVTTAAAPTAAANEIASAAPALVFDRIEHWEKAGVLCAVSSARSASGSQAAAELARSLREAAGAAGFTPDLKPFRAHVTVARKVARLTHPLHMHEVHWPFANFALVESRTVPEGALYSVVESWVLDMRRNG